MKTKIRHTFPCVLMLLLFAAGSAAAQDSAFTYNGRLNKDGAPLNGSAEFLFTIFDSATGNSVIGGPLPSGPVDVVNGLFTVRIDFGVDVFTGPPRWLDIQARLAGTPTYTLLTPRQEVTSSPYAIRAQTAGGLADGTLTASQLKVGGAEPVPGQFLSFSDGEFIWSDPGVAVGDVWTLNGSSAIYSSGNVGIGTSSPTAGYRLEVSGATLFRPANGSIQFGSPSGELGVTMLPVAGNRADVRFDGSTLKLLAGTAAGPPSSLNGIAVHTSGNVSIGSLEPPQAKLQVVAQDALSLVGYQPFLTLADANAGYARSRIQAVNGELVLEPESFVNGSNPNASVIIANSGNVSLGTLTIRGGADLAEPFELSTNGIAKGSVVIIDDRHPGKLTLSTRAYDRRVAGIVSGANGVNPGISLHQAGILDKGENVSLSGRVYVMAEASAGEIKPGDLLTTSDIPGHAMKVSDHSQAQGAVLGKAMTGLTEGRGMVLVLVTLQ